jgi:dihydrodiol dehydrogenase / D-xylose 1-dehydrogenase (NADP)
MLDSEEMKPVRWGILGPGRIAESFARDLVQVEGCVLRAVASRDAARAAEFASRFGAGKSYGGYAELMADEAVDVVYIATPHAFHAEQIRMCLEAGKAVLCEKPVTVSPEELRPLIALAEEQRCFFMEGLWSRFSPVWQQASRWIVEGRIGTPRHLTASFGFRGPRDPQNRLLNPALGGGAMWDVGIYTLAFATAMLGTGVEAIHTEPRFGKTGVDEDASMMLRFTNGAVAQLFCSVSTQTLHAATVVGEEGRIVIPDKFWNPERVELHTPKGTDERMFLDTPPGFQLEILHVRDAIRDRLLQSPLIPLAESLLWQELIYPAVYPAVSVKNTVKMPNG